MSSTSAAAPVIASAEVTVDSVEQLSPAFRRLRVSGPELRDFSAALIGTPEDRGRAIPCRDAYVKLLVPPPGREPSRPEITEGFRAWFARPDSERGWLRTYTVRSVEWIDVDGQPVPRLTLEFVVHAEEHGPGGTWAASARPGDRVFLLGPGHGERPWSTWSPGSARRIVAVGDETAVPALLSIAQELQAQPTSGVEADIVLEVPTEADAPPVASVPGTRIHTVARDHSGPHGVGSVRQLAHVLALPTFCVADVLAGRRPERASTEPLPVWEVADPDLDRDTYVFLAGEAASVKAWRRLCVDAAGIPKDHVTFMGYWRRGHAES